MPEPLPGYVGAELGKLLGDLTLQTEEHHRYAKQYALEALIKPDKQVETRAHQAFGRYQALSMATSALRETIDKINYREADQAPF